LIAAYFAVLQNNAGSIAIRFAACLRQQLR